jgi:histidyl-tRNA synthetase
MGVERVLLAMKAAGAAAEPSVDVFVVHSGEAAEQAAWRLAEEWRDAGKNVVLGAGGSFKSQMKKADASGARFAVIIGEDEAGSRRVTLKPLRGGGEQRTLDPREALAEVD